MTNEKNRRYILALASISFFSALYLWLEQDHAAYVYPYSDHGLDDPAFQIRQPKAELSQVPEGLNDHEARELAVPAAELGSVGEVLSQFPEGLIDHEMGELASKLNNALGSASQLHNALGSVGEVLDETQQGYNSNEEDRLTNICGRNASLINTLTTIRTTNNQNRNQVDFVLKDIFHKAATTPKYQPYHSCQPFDKTKPTLILGKGKFDPWLKTSDKSWRESWRENKIAYPDRPFGRTGNQLQQFIRSLQYVRDHNLQLAMLYNTYMLDDISSMFMVYQNSEGEEDWVTHTERTFCIKIFFTPEDLKGVNRYSRELKGTRGNNKVGETLMHYKNMSASYGTEERVSRHANTLKLLYQHYNTGKGVNLYGNQVKDMCSGINAVFFQESSNETPIIYSAIHHRQLEHGGAAILKNAAKNSGCHPLAALDMTPEYIKSILLPLGMLQYPIVIMTDGQNERGLKRLKDDPDIGPRLRLVPKHACWVGGDVALGVVANVFIGNPASTLSGAIARSRTVFGYGNTYMYTARDEGGQWTTTCADDCLFDARVPREDHIKSTNSVW